MKIIKVEQGVLFQTGTSAFTLNKEDFSYCKKMLKQKLIKIIRA